MNNDSSYQSQCASQVPDTWNIVSWTLTTILLGRNSCPRFSGEETETYRDTGNFHNVAQGVNGPQVQSPQV